MSGAEDTSLLPAQWVAAGDAGATPGRTPRRRLFRKYALLVIALVGTALLVNSGFDFWFSYQENKAGLIRIQQEKAEAAARRIEEAIGEYQRQIGWTTHAQWAAGPLDARRQDYFRLLRQVPAITELTQLDSKGLEELTVSRLKMDVIPAAGAGEDFSKNPAFIEAKAHRVWFSPVYFRKESEPYMTMGIAREGKVAGVTVAEINLKLIWDVITALKIGQSGYAFVVDERGRLIAHPDISLVLRDTDLSKLPQVAEALAGPGSHGDTPAATVAQSLSGRRVLTAHAVIAPVGWQVFVEVPLAEAFAPLYGAALRTLVLLAFGLIAATLVALVLARRMTGPIRAIEAGAARIGAGEFDRRIEIHTGDELEALAGQFNRMGEDLQKSYAELEQRVADRTAELSESLEQQTATAEVLGVINSSPGDLVPVFEAMLDKALHLCGGAFGILNVFDGRHFQPAAMRGVPAAFAEWRTHNIAPYGPETGPGRIQAGESVVHNLDLMAEDAYRRGDPNRRAIVDLGGARSHLAVALRKDDALLGTLTIYRQEVRPFSDKQIALLQNFAAQAVIAMENARLITETREALEQQTATAEVLGVINASPGDLAPVFDAILDKAHSLCGIAIGSLQLNDGGKFRAVAVRGAADSLAELLRQPLAPLPGSVPARLLGGERFVQVADIAEFADRYPVHPRPKASAEHGLRTALYVPLRREAELLGYITAFRQEVRQFSDKEIALLQAFAAQAVIAMENARLITETQEALEQQTATAEVLEVINASPGDLTPVFDTMLDKAMRLCEASFGQLNTYEDGRFHTVAMLGVPAALTEFRQNNPPEYGPGTGPARVLAGERIVHTLDLKEGDAYVAGEPNRRALVDLGGARTSLLLPLLKEDAVLGTIMIYRQEVRAFTSKQVALLQNFAAQAVIAMENARLITETREALEQQTATAEVLQVINSSPGDLDPVFDAILEKATRLCEFSFSILWSYDGRGGFRAVALNGVPAAYARFVGDNPATPPPGGQGGLAQIIAGKDFVHFDDIAATDAYQSIPPARALMELAGARTNMLVALRKEGTLLGAISAFRQEVRPFSDKQIALLQNFAAQAVIAMENARLLDELRGRTDDLARSVEELKALSEVGQAVSSTLDLHAVLVTILNRSITLAGADAGVIFRYSRAERAFHFVEAVGWDEETVNRVRDLNVGETVTALGDAVANRAPLQITDLERRPSNPLRDSALAAGFRSALVVPLVGADRIMGATILERRAAGEFPEATIRLMQALASQSVLAIQNARLFREIADKSEQLAQASQHKSQFLANMSHELRTPLNAILGYTELMADGIYGELPSRATGVLERVQNNGKHLLALINDVLDLAKIEAGQLTMQLDNYAMPDVVQSVVSATEGLANTKGLKFTADVAPGLPPARGDARRLSQVLLNLVGNAVKFTDTGEVAIGARAENGSFILTVRDTGPGIAAADQAKIFEEFQQVDNSNTRKKGGTGLGLAISRRMVEMQGGTISVESELGHGATFRVILPVRVEEVANELPNELNRELLGAAQ